MLVYSYDKDTLEYTNESEASLDIKATEREGKDVWLVPAYATLKKPPTVGEHKSVIFEDDTWKIKDDYRGCYICNEALNVLFVQQIGALPEGFIVITQQQAEKIAQDQFYYIVQDGELVVNPNYEKDKEKARKERIAKLGMTKYDFFKYVCQPYDIDYQTLITVVNSNDEIAAAWNLCGHVFRGDTTLTDNITKYIPTMTEDALDAIYEEHGKEINE
jgi:hypothetical protein